MAAYTFTNAQDIMPAGGSIANSTYSAMQSVRGNNNPDIGYSDNEIRNRVIGNVNYRLEIGKNADLLFSLFGKSQNQGRFVHFTVMQGKNFICFDNLRRSS